MITIHAAHADRANLTRQLVHLAGGDSKAVHSGTAGVTVTDDVALAYLTATRPPAAVRPVRKALPAALAEAAKAAEIAVGIGDPDTRAPTGADGARAPAPRTRKAAKTTTAPEE